MTKESNIIIQDTLRRCQKMLSQVEYMRLSHWAWQMAISQEGDVISLKNDSEAQFLHLSDAPPVEWEGEHGTHPLLPFVQRALDELGK